MKYKYLTNIKTGDLIGVYLNEPKYNESLYSLCESTESEGVAMFGVIFSDYLPKIEDDEIK